MTIINNAATLKKVNAIAEMYKMNVEANKVGTHNWAEQFTAAWCAQQDFDTSNGGVLIPWWRFGLALVS